LVGEKDLYLSVKISNKSEKKVGEKKGTKRGESGVSSLE